MAANAPTNNSSGGWPHMDIQLLEAASSGNSPLMKALAIRNPSILLGTTPQGNNCIHIASVHGHLGFCRDALQMEDYLFPNTNFESLLSKFNHEWETPLAIAVALGHVFLASDLLERCHCMRLRQAILQQDKDGFNALHHAIRNRHEDLALKLIEKEPLLSQALSNYGESPMFVAVMRHFTKVSSKLLDVHDSFDRGKYGRNALHAAARNGNSGETLVEFKLRSDIVLDYFMI
jgi:ankyrin repeat protein